MALFWVVGVPQAAAAPLSVSLDCNDTLVEVDAAVDCTADVTGQAPDATLVYTWTLDGQAQQETDSELSLSDVRVGPHQVTVVVQDTAHGISSAPQSTSFSRDADLTVPPVVEF